MARNELAMMRVEHTDPLEERIKARNGEKISDLCRVYLSDYAKPHKKSWKDDERRINNRILPQWRNRQVSTITKREITALHQKIGSTRPYEANRMVELLSKMFSLAKDWGFIDQQAINPASGITAFKEEKRDRWVTPEELPKLAQAIEEDENPYARHALWLYLLTGVRKSELLSAKWEYIDWVRKEIRIPETKTGKVHHLPLSGPAVTILEGISRVDKNPHILPGVKAGSHMVNIDKPWRRIRARATVKLWAQHPQTSQLIAGMTENLRREPTYKEVLETADTDLPPGIEDVRLHDLRRTVGSWMAQRGNSLHLIGKVLNHSNSATTAVYARFGQDQLRAALEDHGARLLRIVEQRSSTG
jgi:integrase